VGRVHRLGERIDQSRYRLNLSSIIILNAKPISQFAFSRTSTFQPVRRLKMCQWISDTDKMSSPEFAFGFAAHLILVEVCCVVNLALGRRNHTRRPAFRLTGQFTVNS
jgi:hypothetical protein